MEHKKIIGIGLNRTGTRSIYDAVKAIGFNPIHEHELYEHAIYDNCNCIKDILNRYDAIFDGPSPYLIPQLLMEFPDAYFISTERDLLSWLASRKKMYLLWKGRYESKNEDEMIREYREHERMVDSIVGKCKLLRFRIGIDGWKELCSFLELPLPTEEYFPHVKDPI